MISTDIEKEIQQENKVILGLSLRKGIVMGLSFLIIIILVLILGFDLAIYPLIPIAGLAWFAGWYKKDGLNAEKIIIKKIREKFYKNTKRAYRTKNHYIALMNKEYKRHKNLDMNNKKIAKEIKKEIKENKKRIRKSTLKAIQ